MKKIISLKSVNNDVEIALRDLLIKCYDFLPLHNMKFLSSEKIISYHLMQIKKFIVETGELDNTRRNLFIYVENSKILGLIVVEYLQWDTEHFKKEMAGIKYFVANNETEKREKQKIVEQSSRLFNKKTEEQKNEKTNCNFQTRQNFEKTLAIKKQLLKEVFKLCLKDGIEFLTIKCDTSDITSIFVLQNAGFKLINTDLLFMHKKVDENKYGLETKDNDTKFSISVFSPETDSQFIDKLMHIAKNSPVPGEFHLDPHLPKELCDELYAQKVKNCCFGNLSDFTYLAKINGECVGFDATRIIKDLYEHTQIKFAFPVLTVINPDFKHTGIGGAFRKEVVKLLFKNGVDVILGPTQIVNMPMIKLLLKLKAEPIASNYIFHKWF